MGGVMPRPAARVTRGKCRIYFGYCAGVGKTDAMLADAQRLRGEGVESHREANPAEFDLDALLLRRPQLILIDELAQSNHRTARHAKRWQDVEELLDAGIDVFTTLNVLHLESLKDVVRSITNVRVRETVPDTFFDRAEEVILVDRPVDELLARFQTGKPRGAHSDHGADNLLQKSNLLALRELAMRRSADRVMRDVWAYRADQSVGSVWRTAAGLIGNEQRSSSEPLQEGIAASPPLAESELEERRHPKQLRYLWAAVACGAVTMLCMPLAEHFDRSNIVAIFLLAVVLVAVRFGRGPSALAAVLSVCAFDFFFVPPRFSFVVSDVQYLLTFLVMLAVGLITGQLTAGLRSKARLAAHREERAGSLYAISRELSAAMEIDQVVQVSSQAIERTFRASAVVMLPDKQGKLSKIPVDPWDAGLDVEVGVAQWAFEHGQPAGFSTETLTGSDVLYLPLRAPSVTRGVLAVKADNRHLLSIPEQRQLLDTYAALVAIALERVHYVGVAQEALVKIESERLRNSLLAAVSHDLRTPLTVLQGLAEVLAMNHPPLSAAQLEAAELMQDEARRMSALVHNLLDMARIERGEVKLHLEWQPFEEVAGAATNATEQILKKHQVQVRIAQDLPLIEIDATLIARVLVNLLENAAKYTPAGSKVTLSAAVVGEELSVSVADTGPGLPPGREDEIFEKFTRGNRESNTRGVGLGLTICRAIVESHRGKMIAGNQPGGGAIFSFTLPLGSPPEPAAEVAAQEYEGTRKYAMIESSSR
jgi:K+-sensing histidine kinase KdpD